jgi:hypothetical protein
MMLPSVRRIAHQLPLACILVGYLLLCGAMLPRFLHRAAPDAVSYLTIARKYRAWEFSDAVNGYWSPLLSWLLAPLLCLGAPTEVTAKCLQVAIGAGALSVVWWLGKRLELPGVVGVWTTLALVPAVAMYALSDTTPDLLVAVLLATYIGVVIGKEYPRSPWQGAACGLLGALAYLAKAYAFPFFLAHYVAVSCYLLVRRRTSWVELRSLAAATAAGLLVFAVVAGGWATLLSRKYSRMTIGTTGSYQFNLAGQGHPTEVGGLYPPANRMAISAWEDPSNLRIPPRQPGTANSAKPKPAAMLGNTPFAKAAEKPPGTPAVKPAVKPAAKSWLAGWPYNRVLHRIYYNGVRYLGTLFRLSPLSPFILLGLLIACWRVPRGPARDRCVILLGTLLLYPAGYLLIFINERFFWLIAFLLSLSAGLLTTALPVLRRNPWRTCWAVAVAVSFTLWPAWVLARLWHHVLEETPGAAARLRPTMPPGTRIASDLEWGITNSIAFHLDARYYGLLRPDASADEQERQLLEHHIRYLLVWGDPARYPFLTSGREVPTEPVAGWPLERWPHVFELPVSPDRSPSSEARTVDQP